MTKKTTALLAFLTATALLAPVTFAETPEEIGQEIGKLYVQALKEVTELMEARPPAAELMPKVEALKESYVEKLVALGRERLALSDAENSTVNLEIRSAMREVPRELFTAYSEGQQHYFSQEPRELGQTIADFNVITQYADFELLKKQSPKEAERLGIE